MLVEAIAQVGERNARRSRIGAYDIDPTVDDVLASAHDEQGEILAFLLLALRRIPTLVVLDFHDHRRCNRLACANRGYSVVRAVQ